MLWKIRSSKSKYLMIYPQKSLFWEIRIYIYIAYLGRRTGTMPYSCMNAAHHASRQLKKWKFGVMRKTNVMYTYKYTHSLIHMRIHTNTNICEGKFGYQMISESFFFIMPVCDGSSDFLYSKKKRETTVPMKRATMAPHSEVEKGLKNIQKSWLLLAECRGTTIWRPDCT